MKTESGARVGGGISICLALCLSPGSASASTQEKSRQLRQGDVQKRGRVGAASLGGVFLHK